MRRKALYSASSRPPGRIEAARKPGAPPYGPASARGAAAEPAGAAASPPTSPGWRQRLKRYERPLLVAGGALFALLLVMLHGAMAPEADGMSEDDIDAAVQRVLETTTLPSPAAKAYEVIRPSVVRVSGWGLAKGAKEESELNVGTGVVIVESGLILTNLHVVLGTKRVKVTFSDGLESDANIVSAQPENDLAVLQATTLPDDLVPATMRSTADLLPGDRVVAVGFPFGIGPSASAGVVSGLRREYLSPEGKRQLTNLIQFDAAANPGNSGGPLVTSEGEVVGIVTGILNPGKDRVFIGIGFAVPIENAAAGLGVSPF